MWYPKCAEPHTGLNIKCSHLSKYLLRVPRLNTKDIHTRRRSSGYGADGSDSNLGSASRRLEISLSQPSSKYVPLSQIWKDLERRGLHMLCLSKTHCHYGYLPMGNHF